MRRIEGIVQLVNTFLPVLVGIGLLVFVAQASMHLNRAWARLEPALEAIVEGAEDSIRVAAEIKERTEEDIQRSLQRIDHTVAEVQRIRNSVAKPISDVGQLAVPLPKMSFSDFEETIDVGFTERTIRIRNIVPKVSTSDWRFGHRIAAPFNDAFEAIGRLVEPVGDLKRAIKELDELKKVQAEVVAMQAQLATASRAVLDLVDPLVTLLRWVGWALMALIAWLCFSYLFWCRSRIHSAWSKIA